MTKTMLNLRKELDGIDTGCKVKTLVTTTRFACSWKCTIICGIEGYQLSQTSQRSMVHLVGYVEITPRYCIYTVLSSTSISGEQRQDPLYHHPLRP